MTKRKLNNYYEMKGLKYAQKVLSKLVLRDFTQVLTHFGFF